MGLENDAGEPKRINPWEIYRPFGSPLADEISVRIDEKVEDILDQERQADELRRFEEEKARVEEILEAKKKEVEEREAARIRHELLRAYNDLGIQGFINETRRTVWRGGRLTGADITSDSGKGSLVSGIEARYASAEERSGRQKPRIFNATERFEIELELHKGNSMGDGKFEIRVGTQQLDLSEATSLEDYQRLIREAVVEDSAERSLDGRLPLSELRRQGRRKINEINNRYHYDVEYQRGRLALIADNLRTMGKLID